MSRLATPIRKNDNVLVITGKDRGKRGRNPAAPEGGIVERNGSIHISNLALVDPESKKPTRIGTKLLENGKRVRIAKRSGAQIDQ